MNAVKRAEKRSKLRLRNRRVAELLFSDGPKEIAENVYLADVQCLLVEPKILYSRVLEYALVQVQGHAHEVGYKAIAKAVHAAADADPENAHKWLERLSLLFDPGPSREIRSPRVCAGIVLGLFLAAKGNARYPKKFDDLLADILVKIITNRNPLLYWWEVADNASGIWLQQVEGNISNAITEFVSSSQARGSIKIIERVLEKCFVIFEARGLEAIRNLSFTAPRSEGHLTKIGAFLASQLVFKVWSRMDPIHKIMTIGYLERAFASLPEESES